MFIILVLFLAFIGYVLAIIHSHLARNWFYGLTGIAIGYYRAFYLIGALQTGDISINTYHAQYKFCYFVVLVGCAYLLPAMAGIGRMDRYPGKDN